MNPLFSLLIVLCLLLLFLRGLLYLKTKLPTLALFGQKSADSGMFNHHYQLLQQYNIDQHYKVVIFLLNGQKHAFLLGPTQAIALDAAANTHSLSPIKNPKQGEQS
ncbi:MAG: hypothetical protein Q8K36_03835 [Alphaproteobacteria bacterium]|nr:hypothetical protein [Alphaproteobacteria bacterium]